MLLPSLRMSSWTRWSVSAFNHLPLRTPPACTCPFRASPRRCSATLPFHYALTATPFRTAFLLLPCCPSHHRAAFPTCLRCLPATTCAATYRAYPPLPHHAVCLSFHLIHSLILPVVWRRRVFVFLPARTPLALPMLPAFLLILYVCMLLLSCGLQRFRSNAISGISGRMWACGRDGFLFFGSRYDSGRLARYAVMFLLDVVYEQPRKRI